MGKSFPKLLNYTQIIMKFFVVALSIASCYAAPAADADAQLLLGGHALGLGYSHGLLGAHIAAAPVATVAAAPAVAAVNTVAAAPAVAVAAPAVHTIAAPAVAAVHAAPVAVATAPVVHHVGYQVHHQVQHVPQVSVQKHVTHHTTQHVINHAPVVGAYAGLPIAAPAAVVETSE